jgi:hypothetical protein
MKQLLLLLLLIVLQQFSFSQTASDFIVIKKKNNRTVKTYFPGLIINFTTTFRQVVSGQIVRIQNDSVFVKEWDIRVVATRLGVTMVDTAGSFITAVHYREIATVFWEKRKKAYELLTDGTLLMVGGLGYTGLNVINGVVQNESIGSRQNMQKLAIALGVAGTGFFLKKLTGRETSFKRRFRVAYIQMNKKKGLQGF